MKVNFMNDNNYTCHSGGCPGADMTWETEGEKYGVKTIAYSFEGHTQYGKNQQVLTVKELEEGFEAVMQANKTLKRYPQGQPIYVKNLLSRNWFQVKNSESIFAVGYFETFSKVKGGTGWAVQMAIDNYKPIYFFDQDVGIWTLYDYKDKLFYPSKTLPILTKNFAGIGTREINNYGIIAICKVFESNFNVPIE